MVLHTGTQDGSPVDLQAYVTIKFDHGKLKAVVEPDLPFPVAPHKPIQEQLSAGEIFHVEPGHVEPPKPIYAPNPVYSQAALAAKYQGVVVASAIVGPDGNLTDVWIKKTVGLGLDQLALASVRGWKFQPATKEGKPVAVLISVEVAFRVY